MTYKKWIVYFFVSTSYNSRTQQVYNHNWNQTFYTQ